MSSVSKSRLPPVFCGASLSGGYLLVSAPCDKMCTIDGVKCHTGSWPGLTCPIFVSNFSLLLYCLLISLASLAAIAFWVMVSRRFTCISFSQYPKGIFLWGLSKALYLQTIDRHLGTLFLIYWLRRLSRYGSILWISSRVLPNWCHKKHLIPYSKTK